MRSTPATGDLLDRAITREVTVPVANPTLSFTTRYNLEETWDFGFVQVSTDGGATYTSIACPGTRTDTDEGAYPTVAANVPGYTGLQETWTPSRATSARTPDRRRDRIPADHRLGHGGQRERDDPGRLVGQGRVRRRRLDPEHARRVEVEHGAAPLPGELDSPARRDRHEREDPAILAQIPLGADGTATLTGGELRRLLGNQVDLVGVIVTFDDPTESAYAYAPYTLTVNGVVQPGGGGL